MATVTKPFTTAVRRLAIGDRVSPADDFSPRNFGDLVKGGFIQRLPAARRPGEAKTRRKI